MKLPPKTEFICQLLDNAREEAKLYKELADTAISKLEAAQARIKELEVELVEARAELSKLAGGVVPAKEE